MPRHRIFGVSFASTYPLYVAKAQCKDRSRAGGGSGDLLAHRLRRAPGLQRAVAAGVDLETFFAQAPRRRMNPHAHADHRSDLRMPGGSDRRSADAADPLDGQARRRTRPGQGDDAHPAWQRAACPTCSRCAAPPRRRVTRPVAETPVATARSRLGADPSTAPPRGDIAARGRPTGPAALRIAGGPRAGVASGRGAVTVTSVTVTSVT